MDNRKLTDFVVNSELMTYISNVRKSKDFKDLQFDYYTRNHFYNEVCVIPKQCIDISAFHLNIRSLNANHRGSSNI